MQPVTGGHGGRRRMLGLAMFGATGCLLVSCTPAAPAPAPEPTQLPTQEATVPLREAREGWKVFSDPSRRLSFELPQDWLVQPVPIDPDAFAPDSLHYAVRAADGRTMAELHTGIRTPEVSCEEVQRTPYHVIVSEPLDVDDAPNPDPRYAVQLITGFRYFGAYGITDQVEGDGLACTLVNTVDTGKAFGRISFGDVEVLAPTAPAETSVDALTFGTIGEAEEHYSTPDFETIGTMIGSFQVSGAQESR